VRFGFALKASSYLVVASALLTLVLSGELGPVQVALGVVAAIASWFRDRPPANLARWVRAWTILSVVVFAYSVVAFLAGTDILIVGAHFLVYLLVAKLFNRRECKDYQQIFILTFLMLVASTVLNASLSYGALFLVYGVAGTWAMILLHLRRELEDNLPARAGAVAAPGAPRPEIQRVLDSRRIVGPRFLLGTSAISLVVFVGATVMFLAIPRIGFGLFFNKRRDGIALAGFSDRVELGGHGLIKDDPTVVMRVKIPSARRAAEQPLHWRGVAFDGYRGGRWFRGARAPRTELSLDYGGGRTRVHLRYAWFGELEAPERAARLERGLRQEIYLEPMGNDVLFGASLPTVFEFDTPNPRERAGANDELRHPHGAGVRYVVYSDPDSPPAASLRAARGDLPPGYEVYLDVPEEITERVRALARDVTRGAATPYDRAVAIEDHLRSTYAYTLRMEDPGGREPIDAFLFERRQGHCEYFSSAMAIMLRAVGVPSRNVNGFLGGEWNEYGDYVAVRSGDAHSWVEAFFPGVGWVTFDPTPPGATDRLGRGAGLLDKLGRFADTMRLKWFQWVIEYDLHRQLSVFKALRDTFGGGGGTSMRDRMAAGKAWLARNRAAAGGAAAAAAALLGAIGWWRRRRGGGVGAAGRAAARSAVDAIYLAVQSRLARRGYPRVASVTPREHAAALRRAGAPGAEPYADLTELYYRASYGGTSDSADLLARARTLRDAVLAALREAPRRRASR
jgi:hypothetical protein